MCSPLRTISQEWTVCILEFFDTRQVKIQSDDYEKNKKDQSKKSCKTAVNGPGPAFITGALAYLLLRCATN